MKMVAAVLAVSAAVVLALPLGRADAEDSHLWAGAKPQGPIKPFVLDMMGTLKKDNGELSTPITFHDTLEKIRWHGHKAMRRTAATTMPGGTEFVRWAIIVFDAKTLLPYYSEWRRADGAFIRREFDGLHISETRTTVDPRNSPLQPAGTHMETVTAKFDLPEPAFAWIEGVGLPVLLAVPLHEGFEGSVPVISGDPSAVLPCLAAPCFVDRMSYRVEGQEEITGISGKPTLTWRVSVPESRFTFWISCDHPRLEGVTWPNLAGEGRYSMGPVGKK